MIQFDQVRTAAHTHSVTDEAVRYYVAAPPDMTPRQIATEFLRGYAQPDELAGTEIDVEVARLTDDRDEVRAGSIARYRGQPGTEPRRIG